ncbi:P2 family phage major capsid protein [Neisseria wadsworthii]|uniref:P2 family phage major capsid protein n=1 Tax=Neisseria wadsworthii TaxID=607711 RepID=UPI0015F65B69|nr:P2 family phage major capsid protein [Neisseria wadsworthii]QMT35683.1 P2 family phage major capsid protein [Neisseria wadsworthii]
MRYNQLAAAIAVMFSAVAEANNIAVDRVSQDFAVEPGAVQKMYDEIAQSSELLRKINIVGKEEKLGETIGLDNGLIGSTTDTSDDETERKPRSIHNLNGRKFVLEQVNFDVRLRYSEIDGWAHVVKDFPARVNKRIASAIAVSMITIGMNGKSRAKTSNFSSNPLLQDVAKGWLQKMREENKTRVMGWESNQIGTAKKAVKYGPGAEEYKNLDAIVTDVMNEMIDERFADRTDFVVLASRRTVGDKYLRIVNASGETATEIEAGGRLSKERTLGGLPVMYVPNMPAGTLFITPLSNLSIYYQTGGERRHLVDNPKKDQLESYQSKNIDFIVEEYGAAVLVENVEFAA